MRLLKLLLIAGLISGAVKHYSFAAINYRLPDDSVAPQSYNVSMELKELKNYMIFRGNLTAELLITRRTNTIRLHSRNLGIKDDIILSSDFTGSNVRHRALNYFFDKEAQMLTVNFDIQLPPRRYIMEIEFYTLFQEEAIFIRNSYRDAEGNTWLVFMPELKPTMARALFPCWDEPAFKATFNISIHHSVKYAALSNTMIREQVYESNGMVWTHFSTTPVMSTYHLAIVLTNLVDIREALETTDVWCRPQIARHVELARYISEKIAVYLTGYTSKINLIPKMDFVGLPNLTYETMGSWGLNIYREQNLIYDEELNPIDRKIDVSIEVARQMAKQWFGNLVSPTWWNHLWLSKTLATFYGHYALSKIYHDWQMRPIFQFRIQQLALRSDHADHTVLITEEVSTPHDSDNLYFPIHSSTCCAKEAALMLMLQHMLSEDVFWEGVIKYLNKHQFSSATPDDLWTALQDALNRANDTTKNYEIKEFMETWLTLRKYPVINVARDPNTGKIAISRDKAHGDDDKEAKWWIPINFATQTNPFFFDTSSKFWLSPQDQNVPMININHDDWIILNLQHTGYYRVNYDVTIWRKIIEYLSSDKYNKIHVLNRAHLLDDAYYFLMKNQLDPVVFMDLVNYLKQETNYVPWYSFKEILSDMSTLFKFPESAFIKRHVLEILYRLFESVGIEELPLETDNTKFKRLLAVELLCRFGHRNCTEIAFTKLYVNITMPGVQKQILPWWKSWTPCTGMIDTNLLTWDKLLNRYVYTRNKEFLKDLICSEHSDVIIYYLNLLTTNCTSTTADSLFSMRDCNRIYRSIVKKHLEKDLVLDYILANFERLEPIIMNVYQEITDIIQNVYSVDNVQKIIDFIGKYSDKYQLIVEGFQDITSNRLKVINETIEFIGRFKN